MQIRGNNLKTAITHIYTHLYSHLYQQKFREPQPARVKLSSQHFVKCGEITTKLVVLTKMTQSSLQRKWKGN